MIKKPIVNEPTVKKPTVKKPIVKNRRDRWRVAADFDSNQFLALLKYNTERRSSAASWTAPQAGASIGLLLVGGLLDFPHKLGKAFGERWLWGVVLFPQPSSD